MNRDTAIRGMKEVFDSEHAKKPFIPGETFVSHAGKVTTSDDIEYLSNAVLDAWFTAGKYAEQFEQGLQKFYGLRSASLVNSGSSANLVAFSALTSRTLGARAIVPGDEVITVAAGFPTTVNPIVQNGAIPVFLDVSLPSYNMQVEQLEKALSSRTKAVMVAHTLGNPIGLDKVVDFCKKHNLWLIEDNCDAFGSKFNGQLTGTFGDISTLSFYPAHHITTGEGGAVLTSSPKLRVLIESFRDWGRDCYCLPGKDNTCFKRFEQQHGDLPFGYDHKFVYSHVGYNLKLTDLQAALGVAQLLSVESFIEKRRTNWKYLRENLEYLSDIFILPEEEEGTEPSWFGFAVTLRPELDLNRTEILRFFEQKKIGTRLLFAGDLTKQPSMAGKKFRVVGDLTNTKIVLDQTFWVGTWPGLEKVHLDYIIESMDELSRKLDSFTTQ